LKDRFLELLIKEIHEHKKGSISYAHPISLQDNRSMNQSFASPTRYLAVWLSANRLLFANELFAQIRLQTFFSSLLLLRRNRANRNGSADPRHRGQAWLTRYLLPEFPAIIPYTEGLYPGLLGTARKRR
jgi:hypothetical protein